jgi:hypothetical protein
MGDDGGDWLTEGADDGSGDWLTEGADDVTPAEANQGDEFDWLAAKVEFSAVRVLYGCPCGRAVPLPETYWCEDSRMVISEASTTKEIDSFLSPDCNQIYGVEQAEMFENKSLNSFECPRCGSTLCTVAQEGVGHYLSCGFCRWDSRSLDPAHFGGTPLVDEKADQLILRLMKLEKEVPADEEVKRLLKDMSAQTAKSLLHQQQQQQQRKRRNRHLNTQQADETQKAWGMEDLEKKLEGGSATKTPEEIEAQLLELFDEIDIDKSGKLNAEEISKLASSLGKTLTTSELNEAIKTIDKDGDREVTYEEFRDWWLATTAQREAPSLQSLLLADVEAYNSRLQVRKTPSWPRIWTNFSLL